MNFLRNRFDEARLALTMLTRFPMGHIAPSSGATLAKAVWAYPIAGALVGAVAGGVYFLARIAHLPVLLATALALVASVASTGALHEDGLADFADGLGGGRGRERKLEIMRDSRIGTYGVVALILMFLLRWSALAGIALPISVMTAWIAAGALSRAAIALILWQLPPARTDGLGAAAAAPPRPAIAVALVLGVAIAAWTMGLRAIPLIAATLLVSGIILSLARRHLGGHTGDVLGACALCCETLCLTVTTAGWM